MKQQEGQKTEFFWQEQGERTFLYILVGVILLAVLMYFFANSIQAQEYSKSVLGSIGQKTIASYDYLKNGTIKTTNGILGNWRVAADRQSDSDKSDQNKSGEAESGQQSRESKAEEEDIEGIDQEASQELNFKLLYFKKKNLKNHRQSALELAQSASYQVQLLNEEEEREAAARATAKLTDGKYIDINLSKQRLYLFQNGKQLGSYLVSSGSSTYPTPTGRYQVNSKAANAYSAKYNLYMPYWMAFIGSSYGIHELPEYANGYKEGQEYLGQAVSHGCVRLGVGAAATVYNFAPVGTPVIVHY